MSRAGDASGYEGSMTDSSDLEIFLVVLPGLEEPLRAEAASLGFANPVAEKGGVTVRGDWREVWRANLELRCATRVLVRIASFRALHLAQLDKRARKVDWAALLKPDMPVRVEASCKASRIYHAGAATQRIQRAITETVGCPISAEADLVIKARIDDDLCTISLDSSGESLHKRGHKVAVNKAPLRETLAALLLRHCGFAGNEPVVDPMCGSGTIVIEAAEMAAGLKPGRSREFAFQRFANFDEAVWQEMLRTGSSAGSPPDGLVFQGSDRDAGAVRMSSENAERAGLASWTRFEKLAISDAFPPPGKSGLVLINPPYGARIGETKSLVGLYHAMGKTLMERFPGWRVGLLTQPALAKATELPFRDDPLPINNGGIRVSLYLTNPLASPVKAD